MVCGSSVSGRSLKRIDRTVLQKMTSLTALNLSDNQLRLFPSCVELTALRHLDVSENCLNSLEFVENMPELEDLRVEGNGLKVGSYNFVFLHPAKLTNCACCLLERERERERETHLTALCPGLPG